MILKVLLVPQNKEEELEKRGDYINLKTHHGMSMSMMELKAKIDKNR